MDEKVKNHMEEIEKEVHVMDNEDLINWIKLHLHGCKLDNCYACKRNEEVVKELKLRLGC